MSKKTTKNHPLEELLEIEEGSTPLPNVTGNPFIDEETDDLEIDEEEFYEKDVDNSLEEVMADAPKLEQFYDDIDKKNADKFQDIYNSALQAFGEQVQEASMVEGRFRARNLEVAAQFLRIGLDSAKDSANQKANKDKVKIAEKKASNSGSGQNTQNNFFLGDRNDLLKKLAEVEEKEIKIVNPPNDDS